MISCSDCILQKKAANCRPCRNMIGKLYLDFITEVKELAFGAKNNNDRVYAIQDCVNLEFEMVNSFTPGNLKDGFKV